jgi:hypothetical protein
MLRPKETRCTPREGQVLTPRLQVRQQDFQKGKNLPPITQYLYIYIDIYIYINIIDR